LRCFKGCYCKPGYLRNDEEKCVPVAQCDAQERSPLPASSIPTCPEKEEFLACGSACAPTCAHPERPDLCSRNCVVGCFCLEGYLRNEQGVCVPKDQCEQPKTLVIPMQPRVCEDANEEFRQCRGCDGTCENPTPLCPRICMPGCACKHGHVRDGSNGKCVPKETCTPKASVQSFMMLPPIKKCGEFETYKSCGSACPPSCHFPHPPRCSLRCIPGCFCQDGYLKNSEGKCVPAAQCDTVQKTTTPAVDPKCSSDRELYVKDCGTQMDCMATCHMPLPWIIHGHVQIPKKCLDIQCNASCVCKFPYVRNENGLCVERGECDNISTTAAH
jgi:hypothetical protein